MANFEIDDLDIAVSDVQVTVIDEVYTLTTSHTGICEPCINHC